MVMKTINNGVSHSYFVGLVEMLRLAKRAGLTLETVLDVLGKRPAGLPMVMTRAPKILGQDTEVGFTLSGVYKDNAVFQSVAAAFDVDTPGLRAAEAVERDAMQAGIGEMDAAMIFANAYRRA
jgi:3-hydroxyisobutyrate dehydrogenase-like beta-hydroxyacid dehydrogenase